MLTYDHPLRYRIGPKQISIVRIKHGVTEAVLSDGQLVRLSLHIDGVSSNAEAKLEIAYQVITEIMPEPASTIADMHEVVQ